MTFSQEDRARIADMYKDGQISKVIAVRFHVCQQTIRNVLKADGVVLRRTGPKRKYGVNKHFFDSIDTEEKAYWLGFLAADGNILHRKGMNRIALALAMKDEEHVKRFRAALSSGHPITYRTKPPHNEACVHIHSTELVTALDKLGLKERKSLTLGRLTGVPDALLQHLFRGYFDGDGSAYVFQGKRQMKYGASVVGTHEWLTWLDEAVLQSCDLAPRTLRLVGKKRRVYSMTWGGRGVAEKVLAYLYKGATVYLPRKMDKYHEIAATKALCATRMSGRTSHGKRA